MLVVGLAWVGVSGSVFAMFAEALAFFGPEKLVLIAGSLLPGQCTHCLSKVFVWQLSDTPADALANVLVGLHSEGRSS